MIPEMPDDVRNWISNVFQQCNEHVSERLTRIPTMHEPALDLSVIERLSAYGAGYTFSSGWAVTISAMYEGGRRHYGFWEIADIGLLVIVRRQGKIVARKIALLQSKRLYPVEVESEYPQELVARSHFWALVHGREEEGEEDPTAPRVFSTTEESRYQALKIGNKQFNKIEEYEREVGVPVYYLLYHPWDLPIEVELPVREALVLPGSCRIGCRVVPAAILRDAVREMPEKASPSYRHLRDHLTGPFTVAELSVGWRLEQFVVDVVMACEGGYLATGLDDPTFRRVTSQRAAPIAAAIAVVFDLPS